MVEKNNSLEARVIQLEEKQAVTSHVNDLLNKEVDRLNQYTRRSNIVFRNVFVPENETIEKVEENVRNMIGKMGLPEDVVKDLDKAHRLGAVKQINGKKHQDVIARFKSHSARYKVFSKRKSLRNIRISPNLTKSRSKTLHEAVELTKNIEEEWGFVFANQHGDLLIRLNEKYQGKNYYPFDSIEQLNTQLREVGLIH